MHRQLKSEVYKTRQEADTATVQKTNRKTKDLQLATTPAFTFGRDMIGQENTSNEEILTEINYYPVVRSIAKRDPKLFQTLSCTNGAEKGERSSQGKKPSGSLLSEMEKYMRARERLFADPITWAENSPMLQTSDDSTLDKSNSKK